MVLVQCNNCKLFFEYRGSQYNKNRNFYCDSECFKEKRKKQIKYKDCCVCHKTFMVKKRKDKKEQIYCSKDCRGVDQRNRIKTKCETCGKVIKKIESKKRDKNYCSTACLGVGTGKRLRKLTRFDLLNIRKMYKTGEYSYSDIAKKYGVNRSTVYLNLKKLESTSKDTD